MIQNSEKYTIFFRQMQNVEFSQKSNFQKYPKATTFTDAAETSSTLAQVTTALPLSVDTNISL